MFSWKEILKFYTRKQKIYVERKKADFDFLVELATACLGGKKSDGEISIDSGEGLDEMDEEQEEALRRALGDDFDKVMGN